MRAATIDRFGGPEEFHIVDDLPVPTPGPDEVVLRVFAAGVNPLDYKIRDGSSGVAKQLGPDDFPLVLGRECSGTVTALGDEVTEVSVGDAVYGVAPTGHRGGCYAEYVALPARCLAPVPEGADPTVLAGTALAGIAAWTAVHDLAQVRAEDTVLVHGGGGGVGQIAVQLAVATGATVYATASGRHRNEILGWGARHVDYTVEDFRDATPRPTAIIDCVYFDTYEPSMDHLAEGGRLVILPSLADLEPARARGIDVSVPQLHPDRQRLAALAARVAEGRLEVEVSAVLPLADVARAHEIVEDGHASGKVVLEVGPGAAPDGPSGRSTG